MATRRVRSSLCSVPHNQLRDPAESVRARLAQAPLLLRHLDVDLITDDKLQSFLMKACRWPRTPKVAERLAIPIRACWFTYGPHLPAHASPMTPCQRNGWV